MPEPSDLAIAPACRVAVDAPAPMIAESEPAPANIAALLSQSRAAHDRKKKAAGLTDKDGKITRHPNYTEAEAEIRLALSLREQAHAADPDHLDPAWATDQAANKGLSHQQMCDWFATYLTIP